MLCYIKDFKSFETITKYDAVSYALSDGTEGSVTIYQKDPVELTQKYIGMWLMINDGLLPSTNPPKPRQSIYYIAGCTPSDDSIDLKIVHPIEAFEREVLYGEETTYGDLIYNILVNDYGENCPDDEYRMTCLNVTNTDETECTVEPDEYGYIVPKDYFAEARKSGVAIIFTPTSDNKLKVEIKTANYEPGVVVIGDGHNQLSSESYDASFCAKVTVIHDLGNITDFTWRNGAVDNTGAYFQSDYYICTELYEIPAKSSVTVETNAEHKYIFVVYDTNGTFIRTYGVQEEKKKYILDSASKILVILAKIDDSAITTDDSNYVTVSYYVTEDFYLSSDGDISSTPSQNRAKGIWRITTANADDDPKAIATDIFNSNTDNHKIEFYSDKFYEYYQPLSMRLRREVVDTIVTSRVHRSSDSRYFYICGNLATTLTDKIKKIEEAE